MQANILRPSEPILELLEAQPVPMTTAPPRLAPPAPPLPPTLLKLTGSTVVPDDWSLQPRVSWQECTYRTPSGELIRIRTPQHGMGGPSSVYKPQPARQTDTANNLDDASTVLSPAETPLSQPGSVDSTTTTSSDGDGDMDTTNDRRATWSGIQAPAHPHIISEALRSHVKDRFQYPVLSPHETAIQQHSYLQQPWQTAQTATPHSSGSMRTDQDDVRTSPSAPVPGRMSPIIEDMERAANIKLQVNRQLTAVQSKTCLPLKGVRAKVQSQQPEQQRLLVHQELHEFYYDGQRPHQDAMDVHSRLQEHRKPKPRRSRAKREFKFFEYNPTKTTGKIKGRRPKDHLRARSPSVSRTSSRATSRTASPAVRSTRSIAQQQQQYYLQLQDMYRSQSTVSPLTRLTSPYVCFGLVALWDMLDMLDTLDMLAVPDACLFTGLHVPDLLLTVTMVLASAQPPPSQAAPLVPIQWLAPPTRPSLCSALPALALPLALPARAQLVMRHRGQRTLSSAVNRTSSSPQTNGTLRPRCLTCTAPQTYPLPCCPSARPPARLDLASLSSQYHTGPKSPPPCAQSTTRPRPLPQEPSAGAPLLRTS